MPVRIDLTPAYSDMKIPRLLFRPITIPAILGRSAWMFLIAMLLASGLSAQFQIAVNANLEMGLSHAGEGSHFFYNGVSRDHTGWRAGVKEANAMVSLLYGDRWALNTRFFLGREEDGPLERFDMPLLNLEWNSRDARWRLQLGRFINPFGLFNEKQLPMDRTMVPLPVTHLYSSRISNIFGGWHYPEGAPSELQARRRGWPLHYYGGYQTGLRADWILQPDRWTLSAAITSGAAFAPDQLEEPLKLGVNARLQWQPAWFWKQGFSFSHGHIMKRTPQNVVLEDLDRYRQTLIGTDLTAGFGYWELSGEAMAGWHRVPFFDPEAGDFVRRSDGSPADEVLFQWAGWLQLRVEPPFLTGSWLAWQSGLVHFGADPLSPTTRTWDEPAWNHQVGLGYKITPWLLFRSTYTWLQVRGASGDLRTWQNSLTAHF